MSKQYGMVDGKWVNPLESDENEREPMGVSMTPESPAELLGRMRNSAFQGRALGEALDVLKRMVQEDCIIMLGYAASMSSAGMWPYIKNLIDSRLVDVVCSTGANITEDIYEAMGYSYYKVDPFHPNDQMLYELGMDRFYDHAADDDDYVEMEMLCKEFLASMPVDQRMSCIRTLHEFGGFLALKKIPSILEAAYQKKIPVSVPALVDCGLGVGYDQLPKDRRPMIDIFEDFSILTDIVDDAWTQNKAIGCIFIGGGVPKDTLQITTTSVAYRRDATGELSFPHKYSIQLTSDVPHFGGLGGATLDQECISWGKESKAGKNAMVFADATITLPLLMESLFAEIADENIPRRQAPDMSKYIR